MNVENTPAAESVQATELSFADFEKSMNAGTIPGSATPENAEETPSAAADDDQTAETADDSETADDKKEDKQDEQPGKKGRGYQRRIDKLTRDLHELRGRLDQATAASTKPAEQTPEVMHPDAPTDEPSLEAFTNDAKYQTYEQAHQAWTKALLKYERVQETRAAETQAQETAAREQAKVWGDRVEEYRGKTPDFDDTLADCELMISVPMQAAIRDSDLGPAMLYHLAKNPAEAERISKLGPVSAVRELGKIEVKLSTPVTPAKRASAAPNPPAQVGGGASSAAKSLTDPNIDFREFEKQANKRFS